MRRNTSNDPGAWLPWAIVEQVVKLDLKPVSRYRVFLAVLATSARFGGRNTKLGIEDLVELTGLSVRTVKSSLADLEALGLIERPARYRLLSVPMLAAIAERNRGRLFSRSQESAMRRALREAAELLGSDPLDLDLSPEWAGRLGISGPVTYRTARESITPDSSRRLYVGAILSLHQDERVQGRDL